jgi:hypothetical protein
MGDKRSLIEHGFSIAMVGRGFDRRSKWHMGVIPGALI